MQLTPELQEMAGAAVAGPGQAGGEAGCMQQQQQEQRVVNQPAASVTELRAHRRELQRGKGFSLMKETSGLIECGSSPAARDRPRCLIHVSCFAPLWQHKAWCKR